MRKFEQTYKRMVDSLLLMMESQIWWLMKPTINLLIYYISGCWHIVVVARSTIVYMCLDFGVGICSCYKIIIYCG